VRRPPITCRFVSSSTTPVRRAKGDEDIVKAAGGVVLRRTNSGRWEVAVVHRPVRNDWSLPKGKLEAGETYEDCALREVEEETGLACQLSRFVGCTEYRDRRGRPKSVAYWLMIPGEGEFVPSDEVDELRWMELGIAERALSYERDRDLLASLDTSTLARSG
jgi:8-oxo-dGTP pyrophosphatase MutT (NUDIX family)